MRAAPEIKVQDVPESAAVRTWILRRVKKLAARHPDITKLRVAVDTPHKRHVKGRRFRVQIDIGLPGSELISRNQPSSKSERIIPALYDAFHRSERQLDEHRASLRHRDRRRARREEPAVEADATP